MKKYIVGRTSDVPDDGALIVDINGRSVGIFSVGGEYFALLNRCPHAGAPLCEGAVVSAVASTAPGDYRLDDSRKLVQCPWHGWEFDLSTGRSFVDPERVRVRPYLAEAVPGDRLLRAADGGGESDESRVEGPYSVERFPVCVEDDYVLVTMPR